MGKVLVTLDDALLARIDRAARRRGLSRSAYLAELARSDLAARPGPGRSARVRYAMERLDVLFEEAGTMTDITETIRSERDAR